MVEREGARVVVIERNFVALSFSVLLVYFFPPPAYPNPPGGVGVEAD